MQQCFHHLLPIKGVEETVSNGDREPEVPRECLPVYHMAPGSSRLPVQLVETRRDLSQLHSGELRDRLGVSALEGRLTLAHICSTEEQEATKLLEGRMSSEW